MFLYFIFWKPQTKWVVVPLLHHILETITKPTKALPLLHHVFLVNTAKSISTLLWLHILGTVNESCNKLYPKYLKHTSKYKHNKSSTQTSFCCYLLSTKFTTFTTDLAASKTLTSKLTSMFRRKAISWTKLISDFRLSACWENKTKKQKNEERPLKSYTKADQALYQKSFKVIYP